MPGLNGWEVARRLRERFGREIIILMVSGNANELVGVPGTGSHDGFVLKPLDQQMLLDSLGRQLGLLWIYEGASDSGSAGTPGARLLPEAAAVHMAGLARLARTGNMRGLAAALAALAEAVPEAGPLVVRLTKALDDFDLAAFQKLLAEQQAGAIAGEQKP
jgi:CheY-like chemotaxis protein